MPPVAWAPDDRSRLQLRRRSRDLAAPGPGTSAAGHRVAPRRWRLPARGRPSVPLVADVSSDFLSRPIDVARYGLLYAGAQKNAGPAGVTVVVIRDDLLDRIPDGLPSTLDYRAYVEHGSRYNTPPVFAIYIVMLITRWLRDEIGGLEKMLARNRDKADLLYEILDQAPTVFRVHAQSGSRY